MLPATIVSGSYLPARVLRELDWKIPIQNGARQMAARRVQEWLTLHGFSVVIDSSFGDATEKRVRDFQAARKLPSTGVVDAATHEALVDPLVQAMRPMAAGGRTMSALAIEYARQQVGQKPREAGGDNSGPWVRAYLAWDGMDARWCAGFVCMALEQACDTLGIAQPIKSSADCDALAQGAMIAGLFRSERTVSGGGFPKSAIVPGSLFLFRKVPNDWTHVGMVEHADATTFDTVEGNTDSAGSSNGFEAAHRTRGYLSKDFIVWK